MTNENTQKQNFMSQDPTWSTRRQTVTILLLVISNIIKLDQEQFEKQF